MPYKALQIELHKQIELKPVFGRTPNASRQSSGVVLTDVSTEQMTKEGQAPLTDSV